MTIGHRDDPAARLLAALRDPEFGDAWRDERLHQGVDLRGGSEAADADDTAAPDDTDDAFDSQDAHWDSEDAPWDAGRDDPPRRGRHSASPRRALRRTRPRLLQLPGVFREGALGVTNPAVVGLILVVVLAGFVLGVRVVLARDGGTPVPAPAQTVAGGTVLTGTDGAAGKSGSPTAGSPSSGSPAAGNSGTSPPGVPVVVHVVGQVRKPGLIELDPGSRVADAVKAAGGATSKADLAAVNLARPLVDGEQIVIPKPGESPTPVAGPSAAGPGAAGGAGNGGGGKVNINTADAAGLDALPGVGPVLAERILGWRTEHGKFSSVDELGEVSGIGEKLLAQLGPLVTL